MALTREMITSGMNSWSKPMNAAVSANRIPTGAPVSPRPASASLTIPALPMITIQAQDLATGEIISGWTTSPNILPLPAGSSPTMQNAAT